MVMRRSDVNSWVQSYGGGQLRTFDRTVGIMLMLMYVVRVLQVTHADNGFITGLNMLMHLMVYIITMLMAVLMLVGLFTRLIL